MRSPLALILLLLAGCAAAPPPPYALEYRAALARSPGAPQDAAAVGQRFVALYADLGHAELPARVASLYADELYFNDTLTTLRRRDEVLAYLQETAERASGMQVELLAALADGNDVYLRWEMRFEFKAAWRRAQSHTVGMTHLRLDSEGRIILHQDFWDSAEGIYRQLPVVGAWVGRGD